MTTTSSAAPVGARGPDHAAAAAAWHTQTPAAVATALGTDLEGGLSPAAAAERLRRFGRNVLAERRPEPWWEEVLESLREPLQLLLIAVGVLYAVLGELGDAITIFLVIGAVAGIEVFNEARAKRAIASLRDLSAPAATVLRAGQAATIPTADVVPGDVVLLQPGDRVPADLRLVETVALRVDESGLTGESVPVAKRAGEVLPAATELGDRLNLAFGGTLVTAGKGRGVVVATGRDSEVGRLVGLTREAREPRTPLQEHLRQLAGWLVWVAIGFSVLVPLVGLVVARRPWQEMLLTGLTLAFATIPEELPILITVVLGLGAYRLARQQAIVKRLRAAETLGSVDVVGTDKTGTLTENRMRVAAVFTGGQTRPPGEARGETARRLLEIGVLANDAQVSRGAGRVELAGDPTETALLAAAEDAGLGVAEARAAGPVLQEYPFDDARQRMSVVYQRDGARWLALKGAPESVLAVCSEVRTGGADGSAVAFSGEPQEQVRAAAERMAADGLRVLAFAERRLAAEERLDDAAPVEQHLTLVGLAGLEDPPRPEGSGAVAELQAAGVRVLMLTGDHPATARAIAERVGIAAGRVVRGRDLEGLSEREVGRLAQRTAVFARIAPEHKLRLVQALQANGEVVAVTGDGVNDAPALRAAAIGVAMGRKGTAIAREAADVVLADDNFATVAVAVRAGRTLYANLRKAVRYYLAAKVALVTASLVAVLLRLPVPFAPVQIILLELFMDLGASTAFVAEPPEGDLMAQPPRDPRRPFMDGSMGLGIAGGGLSLGAAVLVAYLWAWRQQGDLLAAQTAAFAAWMIGHLALAAHMRAERQPLLRTNPLANRPFLVWAGAAVAALLAGTTVPLLQTRLHTAPLEGSTWAVTLAAALLCPSWWEALKLARWRRPASP
jgi:Ca2+-transporting ATPase